MIKRVKFKSYLGYPMDLTLDIIEEEKKYIYAKGIESGIPLLINRKDIVEVLDAKIEKDAGEVKKH
jgi:hypothetical protein